uniref:Uncharacterized protein n=1 Tax=Panagrolaimus superbus TaxID=310955 RepID=A0A914YK18_9BILA
MAAIFDMYDLEFLKQCAFIPLFLHLIFISATFITCCGKKASRKKDHPAEFQQAPSAPSVPSVPSVPSASSAPRLTSRVPTKKKSVF